MESRNDRSEIVQMFLTSLRFLMRIDFSTKISFFENSIFFGFLTHTHALQEKRKFQIRIGDPKTVLPPPL